jgi:hypothetical protein
MKNLPAVVVAALILTMLACRAAPEPAASADASPASPVALAPTSTPQAALDRLDTRAPVPLLPMMANHQKQNMREHLVAVQEIVAGVGSNDYAAIETASKRIGFSEQMGQMCSHMGAGAPGFTEQALAFHHTADKIGDAARTHDMKAVLSALSATMSACTGCHATYKQQLVSEMPSGNSTTHDPPMRMSPN